MKHKVMITLGALALSVFLSGCNGVTTESKVSDSVIDNEVVSSEDTDIKGNYSIDDLIDVSDTGIKGDYDSVLDTVSSDAKYMRGVATVNVAKATPRFSLTYPTGYADVSGEDDECIHLSNKDGTVTVLAAIYYNDNKNNQSVLNEDLWLKNHKNKWLYTDDIIKEQIDGKDIYYALYGDTENSKYHALNMSYSTGKKVKAYTGEETEICMNLFISRKDDDFDFSEEKAAEMIALMKAIVPTIDINLNDVSE